ncbi:TPA: hypothetical protein DDZ86_02760 [Candidatus Dependentiae bacterium]|nr:MAG: hypothetical protein UW09_C0001G0095 [candidate division TM6 bacterium GW2011_GWF2_43_87]HBL98540.1 hypothetical protein [Candidatus Dependentiae bacterium]
MNCKIIHKTIFKKMFRIVLFVACVAGFFDASMLLSVQETLSRPAARPTVRVPVIEQLRRAYPTPFVPAGTMHRVEPSRVLRPAVQAPLAFPIKRPVQNMQVASFSLVPSFRTVVLCGLGGGLLYVGHSYYGWNYGIPAVVSWLSDLIYGSSASTTLGGAQNNVPNNNVPLSQSTYNWIPQGPSVNTGDQGVGTEENQENVGNGGSSAYIDFSNIKHSNDLSSSIFFKPPKQGKRSRERNNQSNFQPNVTQSQPSEQTPLGDVVNNESEEIQNKRFLNPRKKVSPNLRDKILFLSRSIGPTRPI